MVKTVDLCIYEAESILNYFEWLTTFKHADTRQACTKPPGIERRTVTEPVMLPAAGGGLTQDNESEAKAQNPASTDIDAHVIEFAGFSGRGKDE